MFDSLEEQMRHTQLKALSHRERMLRWTLIALISVIAVGVIYVLVHFVEAN